VVRKIYVDACGKHESSDGGIQGLLYAEISAAPSASSQRQISAIIDISAVALAGMRP